MKTEALGNMLGQTASRFRSPELAEYIGPLTVKGLDLVKTLKEYHVFHGKSPEEFISSYQSGELLADLVNTLEGKEEKIKGILKKPKSLTSKSANIIKVLRYLRSFPKIPNTYIWDEKAILEGDLETIKGLIFDILTFYKKIPRTNSLSQTKGSLLLSPSLNTNSPRLLMQKPQLGKRSQKAKIIDPREYKTTDAEEMPERVIELSEDFKERVSEWLVSLD